MQYCVSINRQQDKQLEDLKNFHEDTVTKHEDNFSDLVKEFTAEIRNKHKDLEKKLYIYPIFECVNQIIFSFREFKEARNREPHSIEEMFQALEETSKKELAMVFVFFLNAKAFLELIDKYTKVKIKDNYDLFRDIKKIRDLLVHFYEKEVEERKFFVSLVIQRGLGDLSELKMRDIYTKESESVYFSMDLLYFSLKTIFERLKNNPSLFKDV